MDGSRNGQRQVRTYGLLTLLTVAALACGRERPGSGDPVAEGAAQPTDRPFVVFSTRSLTIDRVGTTVAVPAIVGSTVSPAMLESTAPDVVVVTEAGNLWAVGEGHATLRVRDHSGQRIEVEVRSVESLAIIPEILELAPGDEVQLALVSGDRAIPLDARRASWASSAPPTAIAIEGRIQAGATPGLSIITAEVGGLAARASVFVKASQPLKISVQPDKPNVRVGEIVTFGLSPLGQAQMDRWSAKAAGILHQTGPSSFVGLAAGKTAVCAETTAKTACTVVTVSY